MLSMPLPTSMPQVDFGVVDGVPHPLALGLPLRPHVKAPGARVRATSCISS